TVVLHAVPLKEGSQVPAQTQVACTYGMAVVSPASSYLTYTSHEVDVRLYRPGYDLVRLTPWEWTEQVEWLTAPDLVSQEGGLDGLYGLGGRGEKRGDKLKSGSDDAAHRESLLFGAAEYERLSQPSGDPAADLPTVRARCLEKAKKLRALAGQ